MSMYEGRCNQYESKFPTKSAKPDAGVMLQALAMRLSEGIDIQYGRNVQKIAWHAAGVDVHCTDGVIDHYDAVISTIPLGVLKVIHLIAPY